ncbi:hypothetical protein CLV58_11764 [Spirosoma oryzae]|uniref:Uncharacterized protein n=1 Tax=Spirosoma oryzae TaxID=1469603 RepID=A0A2T0SM22_9BACT|nr:hypothetical protein [Spirosoma oryzae]PRY34460.1 hypothetical protein CLV58_11764 [Spirosoma oryzae]
MKTIALLLTFLTCQAYGQVPGKIPSPAIKPNGSPERNPVNPGLHQWSDSTLRQLPELLPNAGRGTFDDMPVARPGRGATVPMPTSRPDNAFYRSPNDPSGLVRATLDNMPIHGYDTTARRSATIRRDKPKR